MLPVVVITVFSLVYVAYTRRRTQHLFYLKSHDLVVGVNTVIVDAVEHAKELRGIPEVFTAGWARGVAEDSSLDISLVEYISSSSFILGTGRSSLGRVLLRLCPANY